MKECTATPLSTPREGAARRVATNKNGPSQGPIRGDLYTFSGSQAPEQGKHVPEVGLELHSSPRKRWAPAERCGVRPDPAQYDPIRRPKCVLCTHFLFATFQATQSAAQGPAKRPANNAEPTSRLHKPTGWCRRRSLPRADGCPASSIVKQAAPKILARPHSGRDRMRPVPSSTSQSQESGHASAGQVPATDSPWTSTAATTGIDAFVDEDVPLLQERGPFRLNYEQVREG